MTRKRLSYLRICLAFANSWRLTTAYILIGVKESKGHRSEVVGVTNHLDDATLHQFVNSKTQRPIEFSYIACPIDDVEIGVIEIPRQERPFFLKRKFAWLDANIVWIRDGSSTSIANPDQILRMGYEQSSNVAPRLTLEWADLVNHRTLISPHRLRSLFLYPVLPGDTFTPRRQPERFGWADSSINPNYSEDIIAYTFEHRFFSPLAFRLHNDSSVPGRRIRFIGHIPKMAGMILKGQIFGLPYRNTTDALLDVVAPNARTDDHPDVSIHELTDHWEIIIDFGDIRPRDDIWTANSLFLGSQHAGIITLRGEIRGDNLPDPIKCTLEVDVEAECRSMTWEDCRPVIVQGG